MKSKSLFAMIALLIVASMVLAACGGAATEAPMEEPMEEPTEAPMEEPTEAPMEEPTEAPMEEPAGTPADTIIIGTTDTMASFDPADAYSTRDWEIIKNINEGLLKWKPGSGDELIPALATAMPEVSEDGLTYTVTLKDGIKFGDGTDLTAQMYADSITRLLTVGPDCPNGVADALATPYLESAEATDDSTLVFHLKTPVAYFLQILASATYTPANPNIFPADACELFPEAPIYGTGPWFVSQFTPQEQIVLEPNPYYTGELPPQVSQIIVRFFSDPQTMALAVQNGEIDVAWRFLGPELFGQLQGVEGVTASTINGGSIRYLILNHTMAPTDDPNVVKAIASAVDRDEIADTVFGGQVNPIYSMVPPGFLGANEAFDATYASPDLDAAREYLAASGYTEDNPLELEMWYPPEHYGASTAAWMQVIQQQLEATGAITVTLQSQEWSTYVTSLTGGEAYAVGVLGWFYDYPDPSNYLDPFVYNGGLGTNVALAAEGSDYGEPINDTAQQLVDLMTQADVETDLDARAELYGQVQDVYADLVVSVPLFLNPEYVVFRDNIQGSDQFATPETLNIAGTIEFNYSTLSKTP
jgi:peptide/nickel transport system substrate-binding protein